MLIKPASGNCNLRCRYCFYHSVTENREVKNYGIMSADTLEIIVKKALEFADGTCSFAFQGGEPLLSGFDFFKNLVILQQKYNIKKVKIQNSIQTNGTLINDEWADFFAKNNFLIGLSIDGTKDIHDHNRVDIDGNGSFSAAKKAAEILSGNKVEYNILAVITKNTARHAGQVYNFFKKNDFRYLQFIPCLDADDSVRGKNPYSLTPDDLRQFLFTTFDLWHKDIILGRIISIRYFDNLLGIIMGYPPEACGMSGTCQCQFVSEADGSIYPCDFYVTDKWRLGNIYENSFEEMRFSTVCTEFIEESEKAHEDCKKCRYRVICNNGCRRDRINSKSGVLKNYYCEAYKAFYEYSFPKFDDIIKIIFKNKQGHT